MDMTGKVFKVLIVEDSRQELRNLENLMKRHGYEVRSTLSGSNALKILEEQAYDIVLTGLNMDKVGGVEVLERAKRLYPDSEVIIMSASATIPEVIESMKKGAYDFIYRPYNADHVRAAVMDALEMIRQRKENANLGRKLEGFEGKVMIITQNAVVNGLLETARQIAPTDCSVLLSGESGTGKELFARFLHYASQRAEGPFLAINCGSFNEELLANELFGHERGAFTGASSMKRGLVEMATGGTLFLDEITEMSTAMQVKFLRVLQERELIRVGGTVKVQVDVRVIAASNRDVQEAIREGSFRQDLYYRLNVVSLQIPPLMERRDDIPLLSRHFIVKYSALMKKDVKSISQDALDILMNYDFPGNVRELENIIERGIALANGTTIEFAHLPADLRALNVKTFRRKDGGIPSLEEQESSYVEWVLKECGGNRTLAAQTLGIDRVSLWRKIKKYNIEEISA